MKYDGKILIKIPISLWRKMLYKGYLKDSRREKVTQQYLAYEGFWEELNNKLCQQNTY